MKANDKPSYTFYGNKNAYSGNGAVNIDWSGVRPYTADECKARCNEDAACECITYRASDSTCWKRRDCAPANFADGDNIYDVYEKISSGESAKTVVAPTYTFT